MDWAPYIDSVDYATAPPPPVSFFHPTLEAQLFGDEGYASTGCSPSHVAAAETLSTCGVGQPVFSSSASSCDDSDFNDLIGDTFSENLLNNEPLSLLSAEEIFSQIDYSELHQTDNSGCDTSPHIELPFYPVKEEYCQSATSSRVQSPVNDPLAIATAAFLVDDSSLSVISSDTSSIDNGFLTDQSLDKVELDIAKLKQDLICGWSNRNIKVNLGTKMKIIHEAISYKYDCAKYNIFTIIMLLRVFPYCRTKHDQSFIINNVRSLWI